MQISRLMQLHQTRLSNSLEAARAASKHPGIKGGATENEWIRLFREHLTARYAVGTGFIIDCTDQLSSWMFSSSINDRCILQLAARLTFFKMSISVRYIHQNGIEFNTYPETSHDWPKSHQ
jgi:hypothetical protein